MKDTAVQSLLRGRYGSALMTLASTGLALYGVNEAQQAELYQLLIGAGGSVAALLALVSKLRQK